MSFDTYNNGFIYTIPERILFDHSLSLSDVRLYMIIRSFMDTTGQAYPSNQWISNKLNITKRAVISCINRLIDKKYIIREEINNRRFLRINLTPIPEEVVNSSSRGVKSTSLRGDLNFTWGSDLNFTQLDLNNINIKYINNISDHSPIEDEPVHHMDTLISQTRVEDEIKNVLPDVNLISTHSENGGPCRDRTYHLKIKRNASKFSLQNILNENEFNIPQRMIEDWIVTRNKKKKPVTQTAWNRIKKELAKCQEKKIDPIYAFETMVDACWQSLKVNYFENKSFQSNVLKQSTKPIYDDHDTSWISEVRI